MCFVGFSNCHYWIILKEVVSQKEVLIRCSVSSFSYAPWDLTHIGIQQIVRKMLKAKIEMLNHCSLYLNIRNFPSYFFKLHFCHSCISPTLVKIWFWNVLLLCFLYFFLNKEGQNKEEWTLLSIWILFNPTPNKD